MGKPSEALQSVVRRGKELKLAFAERRAGENKVADGVYRVSGLAAPFMLLQRGAEEKADVQTAAVLALKTKTLLELAGRSSALTEAAQRRGLGMLLLLRRGAERA